METEFSEFLRERIKHHNLTLRRLSELSGISQAHLEGMLKGDWEELPSAPYLRGYLQKLSRVLNFDPEIWWLRFKQLEEVRSSGSEDRLPQNRFALKRTRKYGWLTALAVILVLYFGLRFGKIFGQPSLWVENPAAAVTRVTEPNYILSGEIKGSDQVFVYNEAVRVDANGKWQKAVLLSPGPNQIEITARKFLGGETKVARQIFYEPAPSSSAPAAGSASSTL